MMLRKESGKCIEPADSASWVAFIPHQIHAVDLDEAIKSRLGSEWALWYETKHSDAVYCGYRAS
jgi:hypothetical protein